MYPNSISILKYVSDPTQESLRMVAQAAREGHELEWINLQYTGVTQESVLAFSTYCPRTFLVI